MVEPSCAPPASTFVIRFWREWSTAAGRWRGWIEHVLSGQRSEFVEVEGIMEFVRGCGVMAEDMTCQELCASSQVSGVSRSAAGEAGDEAKPERSE